jgi:hypothetical protein
MTVNELTLSENAYQKAFDRINAKLVLNKAAGTKTVKANG